MQVQTEAPGKTLRWQGVGQTPGTWMSSVLRVCRAMVERLEVKLLGYTI